MSATNGAARSLPLPDHRRQELTAKRLQNRQLAESIREQRLARQVRREERRTVLLEALTFDWVGPYADLLNQFRREPEFVGPSAYWNRQQGRNYPLFQNEQELNLFRAPARILCGTNGYAIGLLSGLTSYVIGDGFQYRVAKKKKNSSLPDETIEDCQGVIDRFLDQSEWYGGEQPSLEEELFARSVRDGEFLLAHYPREDGGTDVRTAEPEQLTMPPDADPLEWSFGIQTPIWDAQKPLAYWLQWGTSPSDGDEFSTDEVTHLRRNVDRSVKRGLTDFCFDTMDALDLASKLRTNLGDAAAQQAAIVGITQHDSASGDDIQAFRDNDAEFNETDPVTQQQKPVRRYRRGEWHDVPKGQNYIPGPTAQSQPIHLQVLQGLLRAAGVRWNAPEWLPSGDSSNNNYASSLTAESPFVRTVVRNQRAYKAAFVKTMWFVLKNHHEVHGIWANGRRLTWAEVRAELDILVEAPSPETRNKLEESQRAAIEIPLGVDSRQRYAQAQGRDWDQLQADNEQYLAETGGQGQPLPMPGDPGAGGQPPSGSPPALESLLEAEEVLSEERYHNLTEAGRAGLVKKVITDKNGVKRTVWVRGEQPAAKVKPGKPRIEDTLARVQALRDNFDAKSLPALAEQLKGHTVAELNEIKKRLSLKASGAKAELAKKIAERALAGATAKPKPAVAKPEPPKVVPPPAPPPEKPKPPEPPPQPAVKPRALPALKPDLKQQDPNHPVAKAIAADHESHAIVEKMVALFNDQTGGAMGQAIVSKRKERNLMKQLKEAETRFGDKAKETRRARSEWFNAYQEAEKADATLSKARDEARDKLKEMLKPNNPPQIHAGRSKGLGVNGKQIIEPFTPTDDQKKSIRGGLDFVASITEGKGLNHRIAFGNSLDGRAGFGGPNPRIDDGNPRIQMGSQSPGEDHTRTVVHELGHYIDEMKPGVKDKVVEFLNYRLAGEKPVDMATIPGGENMKGEMVRKNHFDRYFAGTSAYYVGKAYEKDGKITGTEIVSMGLEALHTDPAGFIAYDPEYAQFIIGILRM